MSSSNWNKEQYQSYFAGQSGHLLGTTDEIEALRPKSPTRDDSKLLKYNPEKKVPNKGPPDGDVGPDGQMIVPPPQLLLPRPIPMVPQMMPMGLVPGVPLQQMQGYQ
jgi:hypothetical protein